MRMESSAVLLLEIYRLLDELQQLGLVQKTLVRPATFKAKPPKEAIEILMRQKKDEFSKMEKQADKFVQRATQILGKHRLNLRKINFC